MLKSLAGFLFCELGMIWRKASQSCIHCKVPVTRLCAKDSKVIVPAIKKLAPMRVRPTKREYYILNDKYRDRSFQRELQRHRRRNSHRSLHGADDAWIQCERMNKGNQRKETGRPFLSEGKEGARIGAGILSSLSLPRHEVRSQDRREKELAGSQVLEQLAGWAAGLGASEKVNMRGAGPPLLARGRRDLSCPAQRLQSQIQAWQKSESPSHAPPYPNTCSLGTALLNHTSEWKTSQRTVSSC